MCSNEARILCTEKPRFSHQCSVINEKTPGGYPGVLVENHLIFAVVSRLTPRVVGLSEGFPVVVSITFFTASSR